MGYSTEAKQQEVRLESINLYSENSEFATNTCPLCDSILDVAMQTIQNINQSLNNIKNDLKFTNEESPRIQAYIETVEGSYHEIESELKIIEKSITALYVEDEKAKTLRDLNIRRGKVIERISLFLERIDTDLETEDIVSKIENLRFRIKELENKIDSDNGERTTTVNFK